MSLILTTKNIFKNFEAIKAADNINVDIESNSTVGLIGSNGAGKTTFLNIITGYITPDSGEVYFEGRRITGITPRQITHLGIYRSFQIPQIFDSMTTEQNLTISASIAIGHHANRQHLRTTEQPIITLVKNSIDQFQLGEYRTQIAGHLPEGVRKLLDIAMALVMKPKLLLLDEPTSGVSADEKFSIMDMVMAAVRSKKIAVLFVEHDMEIIKKYTDRTLAFYNGQILADGTTNEVLAKKEVREHVLGNV